MLSHIIYVVIRVVEPRWQPQNYCLYFAGSDPGTSLAGTSLFECINLEVPDNEWSKFDQGRLFLWCG